MKYQINLEKWLDMPRRLGRHPVIVDAHSDKDAEEKGRKHAEGCDWRYMGFEQLEKLDVKTEGAVQCTICQSPADLLHVGMYVCQANPNHHGDTFVGIFTDMSMPEPNQKGRQI